VKPRPAVLIALIALSIALSCVLAAHAADARIRGANQLQAYYDTNLNESLLDDRFDLDLGYDRFSAGIVFLSHTPSGPGIDPNKYGALKEGIRKRWITATYGPFEARLGDSYATFGTGLIINIYEDKTVNFDNVIDGARLQAVSNGFTIEGIAGANSYGDPATSVQALSARRSFASGWTIGLNGALIDSLESEVSPGSGKGRDGLGGIEARGSLPGGIDFTGEYAIRHYNPQRPGRRAPADGHGGYVALNASAGPLALLLEGKDLLRFKHAYSIPPTVVRQHATTLMNRGSHVPNIRLDDERGLQAEATYAISPLVSLTGNWSRSEARHAALPAWEIYGELQGDLIGSRWILRAAETEDTVPEGTDRVFFERITYGGDWMKGFGSWSAEIAYETQGVQSQDLARASYVRALEYRDHAATMTLTRSPRHSWSVTTEWTNDPLRTHDSWAWAEWTIRLGLAGQITMGGGKLRGGQVCSGGICKIVDPFEGGRVELLTNF
jgi:hypothetical protein